MKSAGVTNFQTGKRYCLKYPYHLGTFSFKVLYSRCIFVKQSRVIFSGTRLKEQWLKVTAPGKPGDWLYGDVWLGRHCWGYLGHTNKISPEWELHGWTGQRGDSHRPPITCTCHISSASYLGPQRCHSFGGARTKEGVMRTNHWLGAPISTSVNGQVWSKKHPRSSAFPRYLVMNYGCSWRSVDWTDTCSMMACDALLTHSPVKVVRGENKQTTHNHLQPLEVALRAKNKGRNTYSRKSTHIW